VEPHCRGTGTDNVYVVEMAVHGYEQIRWEILHRSLLRWCLAELFVGMDSRLCCTVLYTRVCWPRP